MKRLLAFVLIIGALTVPAIAPASTTRRADQVQYIHLVNDVSAPQWYIQEVKDDVMYAYSGNSNPIEFSTVGNKVFFETIGQRTHNGTNFYGTVFCYHSQVGPDPDAEVTASGVAEKDAASVALAVARIQSGPCAPGP